MAQTWCSAPYNYFTVQNSCAVKKQSGRIFMLQPSQVTAKKPQSSVQIRSSSTFRNKVFEDRSTGIICYRDDSGEIICEGYDEGPRLHRNLSRPAFHLRDTQIIDLLHQRLLEIVEGGEFGIGVAMEDDY